MSGLGSTTRPSENSPAIDTGHSALLGTSDLLAHWPTGTLEALSEFETRVWQIHSAKQGAPQSWIGKCLRMVFHGDAHSMSVGGGLIYTLTQQEVVLLNGSKIEE